MPTFRLKSITAETVGRNRTIYYNSRERRWNLSEVPIGSDSMEIAAGVGTNIESEPALNGY